MCGQTVCSLAPNKLCKACQFKNENGDLIRPRWKNATDGHEYVQSYNFAPQTYGPVMLSGSHFKDHYEVDDRIIQPMKWGLVPSWSKDHTAYKMINARSDHLLEKSTYKTPLTKGRRCVVVVDGFYEWAKENHGNKQPYFIHMPQSKQINWEESDEKDEDDDEEDSEDNNKEWSGRRLMFMAGLFDINHQLSEAPLYSYSIITVNTSKRISFIHDRMPAILTSDEDVQNWLDFENVSLSEALKLLTPVEGVEYFKVSKKVGTVSYKESDCIRPLSEDEKKPSEKVQVQGTLLKHFQVIPKKSPCKAEETKSDGGSNEEIPNKKMKQDKNEDDS